MYQEFKAPLSAQLELTSKCNHRCIHCYNHWREKDSLNNVLSRTDMLRIMDNLRECEIFDLLITGGEPLLYPDLVFELIGMAKDRDITCSLNSNATLITPEIAGELRGFSIPVLTSLLSHDPAIHDGITCVKGSHQNAVQGIKVLKRAGVRVSVNMVVMHRNKDHVYDTGCFVKRELGIGRFSATKVHPAQGCSNYSDTALKPEEVIQMMDELLRLRDVLGMGIDSLTVYPICLFGDLEKYRDVILRRNCSAGKINCTIGANGEVRACGHCDEVYGSAIEESLLDIWPRVKKWRDESLLPDQCKECEYFHQCSGGCRMDCKFFGNMKGLDPYVPENFTIKPAMAKKFKLLLLEVTLKVRSGLCFREESFGVILIARENSKQKPAVTHDSAKLLQSLGNSEFTIKEVIDRYKVDGLSIQKFFTNLEYQGIVQRKTPDGKE